MKTRVDIRLMMLFDPTVADSMMVSVQSIDLGQFMASFIENMMVENRDEMEDKTDDGCRWRIAAIAIYSSVLKGFRASSTTERITLVA